MSRAFAVAVFWTYLVAFAIAFCFVFIFPQVTLVLLFLAIFGLIFAVLGRAVLDAAERLLARRILRRDRCPRCSIQGRMGPDAGGRCECAACGAAFDRRGSELEPEPVPTLAPGPGPEPPVAFAAAS